ncbi:hypothetical protein N499_0598 [Wolbachia pipientis wVitA]|nr:hypothetical protein N499_0598 [Wolbachia pipientis wVitA]
MIEREHQIYGVSNCAISTIVFSKTNDKRLKWYYQLKGVSLYIDALEV